MSKQYLKKCCREMECSKCPFGKSKILCKVAMVLNEFDFCSFNYIIKKLKAEIEKVEKEIK